MKKILFITFLLSSIFVGNANDFSNVSETSDLSENFIPVPISIEFSGTATAFGISCSYTVNIDII